MAAAAAPRARRQPSKLPCTDVVRINVAGTRYPVVKAAAAELGMVVSEDGATDCNVYWIDGAVPLGRYLELRAYQKINHFPGMGEISRKDSLARNIQRMKKENHGEYHFFPTTWVLPADHGSLARHMAGLRRCKLRKAFIVKPHNSSMGNGIYLTCSPDTILPSERTIVQEYLDKPFLLDGFKCDLRLYVLVTSCNPLRILVFKDGLVRLSTEPYASPCGSNLEQCFMHLTNYSLNKHNTSFDGDEREDRGSKRTLRYFMSWLRKAGYNVTELWAKMHDVIIKTLLLVQPHLLHAYSASRHGHLPNGKSQFFEILGFDILLDHTLQPWLLEVNRSPSFATDAELDFHIKISVIRDALKLANISSYDKQTDIVTQRQASRQRLIPSSSRISHTHSGAFNFQAEQYDAANEKERRRVEAKERLSQLRKERRLELYENENKGDYVRVYPTADPVKARLYLRLLDDSRSISSIGRSSSVQSSRSSHAVSGRGRSRGGCVSGCDQAVVENMKEHELLDFLSQYEDNESGTTPSWHSGLSQRPSTASFQSLADSNPMGDMFRVMAARLHEEEQTQRTMVALNEMAPFYPGKTQAEVHSVLERIREDFLAHRENIGSFWLISLDNTKRKQLLAPVREAVTCLLHSHWRRVDLNNVRLHHITSRLMTFLLSRRGDGLWSIINTADGKSSWELSFKRSQETISVAELECCRRIVELCRSLLYCAYHYHCRLSQHSTKHRSPTSKCSGLPHLRRRPSLTTPTMPRPLHRLTSLKTHRPLIRPID